MWRGQNMVYYIMYIDVCGFWSSHHCERFLMIVMKLWLGEWWRVFPTFNTGTCKEVATPGVPPPSRQGFVWSPMCSADWRHYMYFTILYQDWSTYKPRVLQHIVSSILSPSVWILHISSSINFLHDFQYLRLDAVFPTAGKDYIALA